MYTTIVVASLVLTNKIIEWHGLMLSACLISFPLIYLFGDIVAEIYGYKESQKLIWFTVMSCFILGEDYLTKWKLLLNGRHFWLRSIGATALGELVNSLIAFPLGFFGDFSFHNISEVMFFSYVLKMIYAALLVYPASLIVTYYKMKGINANDVDFKFNSFAKQVIE